MRDNKDGSCNCSSLAGGCFFTSAEGGACDCKCHKVNTHKELIEEKVETIIAQGFCFQHEIIAATGSYPETKEALTQALQDTIDTVIEGERKRIKKEITNQTLLNNGDDIFVSLGKALWVCDSEEERAAFMKALTPLPDKE